MFCVALRRRCAALRRSDLTYIDPLENFDSVFEFISNFATLNLSFICYNCEIRSRNANKG